MQRELASVDFAGLGPSTAYASLCSEQVRPSRLRVKLCIVMDRGILLKGLTTRSCLGWCNNTVALLLSDTKDSFRVLFQEAHELPPFRLLSLYLFVESLLISDLSSAHATIAFASSYVFLTFFELVCRILPH